MRKVRSQETLEDTVLWLEGEVGVLREALALLVTNCTCTPAERFSGHHVDCPIPQVQELLDPYEPDAPRLGDE